LVNWIAAGLRLNSKAIEQNGDSGSSELSIKAEWGRDKLWGTLRRRSGTLSDPSHRRQRLSFGLFEADLSSGELCKRGRLLHLQDQPFRILSLLLERSGELVSREEIRQKLWPDGTFVDFDEGIDTALKKLRHALGDSADNPIFVETVPRRGYRFIAPIRHQGPIAEALAGESVPAVTHGATETPSSVPGDADIPASVTSAGTGKAKSLRYAASAVVVLLVFITVAVRVRNRQSLQARPELKLRQLTINSIENPVTSGAISPDGKYLAFVDAKGMHIQLVETGEGLTIAQPESLKGVNVSWEILASAWYPDSARFLANAHPAGLDPDRWTSETSSTWVVSVLGGAPRKLRDKAIAWSVSPDGSAIAFGASKGSFGDREIWVMGPSGEQARKLFATDTNSSIGSFHWVQDRQAVLYIQSGASGDTLVSRNLKEGTFVTLLPPSEMKKMANLSWLPDGRLLYSVSEARAVGETCNYWTMRLDVRTAQTIEKPRQLTDWAGFCMDYSGATGDGKRLAFLKSSVRSAAYLADLEAGGTRIRNPRHFTPDDGEDAVADWTSDSRTVLLAFNRGDHYGLYKQLVSAERPEPIVASAAGGLLESAQVSPDDKWAILQVFSLSGGPLAPTPLMRVPLTGGSPELIFPVPPGSGSSCARAPSNLCVLAEPGADRQQMIVTAFDPVLGRRGAEIARYNLGSNMRQNAAPVFGVSPDGTRLAASSGPEGPIQILSLRGKPKQMIPAKNLDRIRLLAWAADGNGLFVINGTKDGTELLHVDLHGDTQVLWTCRGGQQCDVTPSPDGRHLAILDRQLSANLWMMENF
jgi:DNA-binding winged helix-turn-helix (wHTH) protein/Tol biopolymer transport system component